MTTFQWIFLILLYSSTSKKGKKPKNETITNDYKETQSSRTIMVYTLILFSFA